MGYKPIGGIERCILSAAEAVGDNGIEAKLIDDSSTYVQTIAGSNSSFVVEHTLTLVAKADDADIWLNKQFLEQAIYDGLYASIELCCKSVINITSPLKLHSLEASSAQSLTGQPTVTLILKCQDTTINRFIYE